MIPGKMFSCYSMSIPYSDWRARSNDCFLLKFIFLRRIVNPGRDGQIRYLDVSGCKVVTPSMERLSKADDLFSANVEALARDEAYTTWNCTGSPLKTCAQTCGICGSSISGTGNLTGIHKCSN